MITGVPLPSGIYSPDFMQKCSIFFTVETSKRHKFPIYTKMVNTYHNDNVVLIDSITIDSDANMDDVLSTLVEFILPYDTSQTTVVLRKNYTCTAEHREMLENVLNDLTVMECENDNPDLKGYLKFK